MLDDDCPPIKIPSATASPKITPKQKMLESDSPALYVYRLFTNRLYANPGNNSETTAEVKKMAQKLLRRMKPADPFEQMLAEQLIMTHARLVYTNSAAAVSKDVKQYAVFSTLAESIAKTYSKQMQQLLDYRKPKDKRSHFTAIKQTNIAAQQIVNPSLPVQPSLTPINHGQPTAAEKDEASLQTLPRREMEASPNNPKDKTLVKSERSGY